MFLRIETAHQENWTKEMLQKYDLGKSKRTVKTPMLTNEANRKVMALNINQQHIKLKSLKSTPSMP